MDAERRLLLARVAERADRLRAEARSTLRSAVGEAADAGMTQQEIARVIGRSQPEVSRLVREYRQHKFRPTSATGELLVRQRDRILEIVEAHRARNVRVFGSVVRGSDDEGSDIDLLVDLDEGADLMDLAALDEELCQLLGRRVDVVPARLLRDHVASSAFTDAVPL